MQFSQLDEKRINWFYQELIDQYWNQPESLSRASQDSQLIRFKVFEQIWNLENKSILDMGCGFGDLYWYFSQRYNLKDYLWIDILHQTIKLAKQKYPNTNFQQMDFSLYNWAKFDYIFASWSLSFKTDDYKQLYKNIIKKMYDYSNMWVWFNMLNKKYHVNDENFAAYNPSEIYEYCSSFCDRLLLRQDYLKHDFTLYLYH